LAPVKASVKVPATPREMEPAELQPVTLRTTTTPTGPSLDVPARGSATQQLDGPFQHGTSEPAPAMAGAGTGPARRRPRRALAVTAVVLLFVTATVLSTRLAGRGGGLEVDTPPDSVVAVDAQGHAVTDVPVGA